jgi:hypothetical protein
MSTAESNDPGGVPHTVWSLTANKIASSNSYGYDTITAPSTSNLNEWYMVTYTSDGTTLRLYVNDTEIGNTPRTSAVISGSSPYVRLAQYASALDNGLIGKIAYAEFYFTDVLWPDFNEEELHRALLSYQKRERRFGKTSEQIR